MTAPDLSALQGAGPVGYHVTERVHAQAILTEGFLPGWGDIGMGVYAWDSWERAKAYAQQKGWDGALVDPVVLALRDPALVPITAQDLHPSWDTDAYTGMLWHDMSLEAEDSPWIPSALLALEPNARPAVL